MEDVTGRKLCARETDQRNIRLLLMSAYVRSTDPLISARIRWKLAPLAERTCLRQLVLNAQSSADPHRQRPRQAEGGGG